MIDQYRPVNCQDPDCITPITAKSLLRLPRQIVQPSSIRCHGPNETGDLEEICDRPTRISVKMHPGDYGSCSMSVIPGRGGRTQPGQKLHRDRDDRDVCLTGMFLPFYQAYGVQSKRIPTRLGGTENSSNQSCMSELRFDLNGTWRDSGWLFCEQRSPNYPPAVEMIRIQITDRPQFLNVAVDDHGHTEMLNLSIASANIVPPPNPGSSLSGKNSSKRLTNSLFGKTQKPSHPATESRSPRFQWFFFTYRPDHSVERWEIRLDMPPPLATGDPRFSMAPPSRGNLTDGWTITKFLVKFQGPKLNCLHGHYVVRACNHFGCHEHNFTIGGGPHLLCFAQPNVTMTVLNIVQVKPPENLFQIQHVSSTVNNNANESLTASDNNHNKGVISDDLMISKESTASNSSSSSSSSTGRKWNHPVTNEIDLASEPGIHYTIWTVLIALFLALTVFMFAKRHRHKLSSCLGFGQEQATQPNRLMSVKFEKRRNDNDPEGDSFMNSNNHPNHINNNNQEPDHDPNNNNDNNQQNNNPLLLTIPTNEEPQPKIMSLIPNTNYIGWADSISKESNIPIIPFTSLKILRLLGEGAFGEVYLVENHSDAQAEDNPMDKLLAWGKLNYLNYVRPYFSASFSASYTALDQLVSTRKEQENEDQGGQHQLSSYGISTSVSSSTSCAVGEGGSSYSYSSASTWLPYAANSSSFCGSSYGTTKNHYSSASYYQYTNEIKFRGPPGKLLAMKQLKLGTNAQMHEMEREAGTLVSLSHPNIVQFVGMTFMNNNFGLLFEYMHKGDLVNYLRSHNPDLVDGCRELNYVEILEISWDVAKGLSYLAANGFVHRDLAARNCLVSSDNRVKISDFGMSREICGSSYYKMGMDTLVPIRWLPPESILYRKFTVESDVWSFGVLLWEIFSFGQVPWSSYSNSEVFDVVKAGRTLPRPHRCPQEFYWGIILNCWKNKPSDRLTAEQLRALLNALLYNAQKSADTLRAVRRRKKQPKEEPDRKNYSIDKNSTSFARRSYVNPTSSSGSSKNESSSNSGYPNLPQVDSAVQAVDERCISKHTINQDSSQKLMPWLHGTGSCPVLDSI